MELIRIKLQIVLLTKFKEKKISYLTTELTYLFILNLNDSADIAYFNFVNSIGAVQAPNDCVRDIQKDQMSKSADCRNHKNTLDFNNRDRYKFGLVGFF